MTRIQFVRTFEGSDEPRTLAQLREVAEEFNFTRETLIASNNWTELLHRDDVPTGWVQLGQIAKTGRGIATGCNDFFLISREQVERAGIEWGNVAPCIGKSSHVSSVVFDEPDFLKLDEDGRRVFLLNFKGDITTRERIYIRAGEGQGIDERYLLKCRDPWYSMERKPIFPIWVSVFKRGGARFVRNTSSAYSLTNFHGIMPDDKRPLFHDALTALLNSPEVLSKSGRASRKFGGGLAKFEPHDLKKIWLPDLRRATESQLTQLANSLRLLDQAMRAGPSSVIIDDNVTNVISALS